MVGLGACFIQPVDAAPMDGFAQEKPNVRLMALDAAGRTDVSLAEKRFVWVCRRKGQVRLSNLVTAVADVAGCHKVPYELPVVKGSEPGVHQAFVGRDVEQASKISAPNSMLVTQVPQSVQRLRDFERAQLLMQELQQAQNQLRVLNAQSANGSTQTSAWFGLTRTKLEQLIVGLKRELLRLGRE